MKQTLLACVLFFVTTHAFAQEAAEETPDVAAEAGVVEADAEASEAETVVDETDAHDSSAEAIASVVEADSPVAHPPASTESTAESNTAGVRAKFALVIVGDADAALQVRAAELGQALREAGLTGVHDRAIREALLGRDDDGRGDDEDGLGPLRSARRTLALSEDVRARADALERMGRASGADTLVLLARRAPTLRVYDLMARSFYQAVPASPDDVRYIASATRAAAERTLTAPSIVAEAAEEDPEVEVGADEDVPPVRAFFKTNWPYMIAGVLLAGAIVWLVVGTGGNDESPPPVLRFRPGGAAE